MDTQFNGFPVFKGLQKPMEFMGIRGKFLYYIAAGVGIAFFSYLLMSTLFGKIYGIVSLFATVGICYLIVTLKQKEGLHSKKKFKGIVIYKSLKVKEY